MAKRRKKNNPLRFIGLLLSILIAIPCIFFSSHILYKQAYPKKYNEYVELYSKKYKVEENLVYSVIRSESMFNPNAKSNIGARGLMQMTEETFNWLSQKLPAEDKVDNETYDKIFDPKINVKYGTFFLSILIEEFSDKATAVSAYHAGRGIVNKWLKDPSYSSDGKKVKVIPYNNTKSYVKQVINTFETYNKLY